MAKTQPKVQCKPKSRARIGSERKPSAPPARPAAAATKLQKMIDLLRRSQGASINDLVAAMGWQAHSVRCALAGALRRKGFEVTSAKPEGVRTYAILKRGRGWTSMRWVLMSCGMSGETASANLPSSARETYCDAS